MKSLELFAKIICDIGGAAAFFALLFLMYVTAKEKLTRWNRPKTQFKLR